MVLNKLPGSQCVERRWSSQWRSWWGSQRHRTTTRYSLRNIGSCSRDRTRPSLGRTKQYSPEPKTELKIWLKLKVHPQNVTKVVLPGQPLLLDRRMTSRQPLDPQLHLPGSPSSPWYRCQLGEVESIVQFPHLAPSVEPGKSIKNCQ